MIVNRCKGLSDKAHGIKQRLSDAIDDIVQLFNPATVRDKEVTYLPPLLHDSVEEVSSSDQFHHDKNNVVRLEGVLDADDIRLK